FSKLPEETRKAYVRRTLRMPRAADLSLYVLSAGLTHARGAMISEFLDALSLAHEGPNLSIEGEIPEPAKKTLTAAVDKLLAPHPGAMRNARSSSLVVFGILAFATALSTGCATTERVADAAWSGTRSVAESAWHGIKTAHEKLLHYAKVADLLKKNHDSANHD